MEMYCVILLMVTDVGKEGKMTMVFGLSGVKFLPRGFSHVQFGDFLPLSWKMLERTVPRPTAALKLACVLRCLFPRGQ